MGSPLHNDIFLEDVLLIEFHEDLWDKRYQSRIVDTDEAL